MIRTSLVGCGYFGSLYARRILEHPQYELVNIVEQAEGLDNARQFGVPVWDSLDDATQPTPTLVVVCTPAQHSAGIAIEALTRNSHVLLTKPGASTLAQAQSIVRTAKERNLTVSVDYTPRNTGAWQHINLEQPREPMHVVTRRITTKAPRHEVSTLLDLAPHDIALLCDLSKRELTVLNAHGVDSKNGGMLIIKLTDFNGFGATVVCQHNALNTAREISITNLRDTTTWDQLEDTITTSGNGWRESVICHSAKDPITVHLDNTANMLRGEPDNSGIFLRVMDIIDKASKFTRGAAL